jgi:hypothetical protein
MAYFYVGFMFNVELAGMCLKVTSLLFPNDQFCVDLKRL